MFEYWETNGKWYWHFVVETINGQKEITADGSEGYASKGNVLRAIESHLYHIVRIANGQRSEVISANPREIAVEIEGPDHG